MIYLQTHFLFWEIQIVVCVQLLQKKKIPIFHFEAGNRCFDMRVPEETNRIIVDHISDIN